MRKLFLLSLVTLLVMFGCQKNEELIPEQKKEIEVQRRSVIKIGNSDLDPTTPEDLGFQYEIGSSSATASHPFIYKLIKVQFADGTTEAQKTSFRSSYSIYGLNGWELFYWEKCSTKPNIEFWSIRIFKSKYDPIINDPIKAIIKGPKAGPGDGIGGGDEPIECTAQEIEDKIKECL